MWLWSLKSIGFSDRLIVRQTLSLTHALNRAGLDGVVGIFASDNQVGMTIEEAISRKATRVFGNAGSQQVGNNTGHRCLAHEIVYALETAVKQQGVETVEEVVHVLHGGIEVEGTEGVGKIRVWVELALLDGVVDMWH